MRKARRIRIYWPGSKARTTVRVDAKALDDLADIVHLLDTLRREDPEFNKAMLGLPATKSRAACYAFAVAKDVLAQLVALLDKGSQS